MEFVKGSRFTLVPPRPNGLPLHIETLHVKKRNSTTPLFMLLLGKEELVMTPSDVINIAAGLLKHALVDELAQGPDFVIQQLADSLREKIK